MSPCLEVNLSVSEFEVNLSVSEFIDFNSGQFSGLIEISYLNYPGTVFLRTLGQH